ncbi:hypothetical protein ACFZC6_01950 [Streptomyces ossamyceticus]|uniref:hypothetical protein n=1 Tax=Streptomyces ossamyceticus TaxID=249581 RepID=UPI0036E521E5
MTTPADEIAAAAARLRTLAADAADTSGSSKWEASRIFPEYPDSTATRLRANSGGPLLHGGGGKHPAPMVTAPVGDYIAAMDPTVGLALAAWLDSWAGVELRESATMQEDARHALAVARAINGAQQ